MQRHKSKIAALKEEMRLRNKECHVQECHVACALAGGNGCSAMLKDQEVADLEHELEQLKKKILLERHVQMSVASHLSKQQADLQAEANRWQERAQSDSRAQEIHLEVRCRC
jgi:hypothetical protein